MSAALEQLAGQADTLAAPTATESPADGQQLPADGAPAAAPASRNFEALCFILAGFRELACAMLKVDSPRRTLDDSSVEACAKVLAPVADKYGVNLGTYMGGPEAAAVMVAGPILWRAWRALDEELAARKRKPDQVETAPSSSSSSSATAPAPAGE